MNGLVQVLRSLGAARLAASHYSIMVKDISAVFVAGPPVVAGIGEDLDKQALGGHEIQLAAGAVDHVVNSEEEAFEATRRFLSYLPSSVDELPPRGATEDQAALQRLGRVGTAGPSKHSAVDDTQEEHRRVALVLLR